MSWLALPLVPDNKAFSSDVEDGQVLLMLEDKHSGLKHLRNGTSYYSLERLCS